MNAPHPLTLREGPESDFVEKHLGHASAQQQEDFAHRPFGVYLHVPFCATRCGYCDFNTYTAGELGTAASPQSYITALGGELERAAELMQARGQLRPADTVFVGGGTPSLLGAAGLGEILGFVRDTFGLAVGAEVTTESNPESTSPEFFTDLRAAGFTRVSLGMQSVAPHVLATLDRKHTPGRPVAAAREARQAGFEHVNLDMIYGTPGETDDDVRATMDAIVNAGVDHVSAYSLIVEDGTAMARKVRRGELPMPDEDVLAHRYELIDAALSADGFSWYEVSNWAKPGGYCRHNDIYWLDGNWWGAGPGAHSHIGGTRFFNVKHPARYASMVSQGLFPVKDGEVLTDADRHTEKIMLGLRRREGIPERWLYPAAASVVERNIAAGTLHRIGDRVAVTGAGRLLADGIVTDLLLAEEN
ncbi:radical SAM family heme chaperone HemW [Corynebacterium renale]|uniref:Heme chaperone HemW n=1 Tax=Corynebacterium renale TaxID=1724 RepID=A0A2A9DQV7_9CORY|nr:radical SAM family heme chaperone HemW [Corynebacterium renale]PFG28290.1 anaerobic coproporphyrinogen III oxidase [Corynebacterium renale]SQI19291.1 coproporphyrinogen III oxidase [Corynebacterium renale]